MNRKQALGLLGIGVAVSGCSPNATIGLRVASTSAIHNEVIAEIYAEALERKHIRVQRRMRYGDWADVIAALKRGDIDLCPQYAGATRDSGILAASRKHWYESNYGITWLKPATAREGPCLAASTISAERFWLVSLVHCSKLASQMRLAATADFVGPNGGLRRLRACYGGFRFKSVTVCAPGEQYNVLNRDDADVANALTTDAEIVEDSLGVLFDPKRCFPSYSVAPVVRIDTINEYPQAVRILDRVSAALNEYAVQNINMQCDLAGISARDVAEEFIMNHPLTNDIGSHAGDDNGR